MKILILEKGDYTLCVLDIDQGGNIAQNPIPFPIEFPHAGVWALGIPQSNTVGANYSAMFTTQINKTNFVIGYGGPSTITTFRWLSFGY